MRHPAQRAPHSLHICQSGLDWSYVHVMAAVPVLPLSVASSEVGTTLAKALEEQYGERWPILLDALFTERCQRVQLRNIFIQQVP